MHSTFKQRSNPLKRSIIFIILLGSLILSCFSQQSSAAEKPVLTVYTYDSFTSQWGPGPKVKQAFEKQCQCELKYVALEDGVSLLSRLKLEGKYSKADVVLGLDTNLTADARATGLFSPHGVSLAASSLPNAWDDTLFLPYDFGYFAFIYDRNVFSNPPRSLRELVEKKGGPSILIQDPRTSTPGLGLLLWVKQVYGDEAADAWRKLSPKIVTVSKGWSEAYGLFLKGEAQMVLSYTTSPAYHMIAEQKNNYVAAKFVEGHYQQIEVAGVLASSKQPLLAKQFLRFMVSGAFQSIIPANNWMYPVSLPKEELPDAFGSLIDPTPALLLSEEAVARNRRKWVKEWLNALASHGS